MNRSEYLDRIERELRFLNAEERRDVREDLAELYDGLLERGLDDDGVQGRIGSVREVVNEYRISEQLDRTERSPSAASGARLGWMTLTGRLARGFGVQLFGLVWFGLAILMLGVFLTIVAAVVVAVMTAFGYEPFVATFAVSDASVTTGVLVSVSIASLALSALLALRLLMRVIAAQVRRRLRSDRHTIPRQDAHQPGRFSVWLNRWAAVLHVFAGAFALAIVAAATYPVLPSGEFPVVVERTVTLDSSAISRIVVDATRNRVSLVSNADSSTREVTANLRAEMELTFAQLFALEGRVAEGSATIRSLYQEGLSWGINPFPELVVVIPVDVVVPIHIQARESHIDVSGLSPDHQRLVTIE